MMLNKMNLKLTGLFFVILAFIVNINSGEAQVTTITGAPSYTSVSSSGAQYYITSGQPTISGTGGRTYIINRYTQFDVGSGDTANVYLNGANGSLNIVNGPTSDIYGDIIQWAGTSGAPGARDVGDFVFINPAGIIMWAGSSINAGSILLSTSSSSNIPLGPGASTYADLNDQTQDTVLFLQGINDTGAVRFTSPTATIDVMGAINASTTRGVTMFADSISIGTTGMVNVPEGGAVGLYTGNDFIWDFSTDTVTSTDPIASALGIIVDGTINAPAGEVEMLANNIASNTINITGLVNATAVSPNTDGGEVILRTQQPASAQVILDDTGSGGIGAIEANATGTGTGGTVVIQTGDIEISSGGHIWARNDAGSPNGGTVSLISNVQLSPTTLSPTGFIDPASVLRISTISTDHPSPYGNLYIFDDANHPGLEISGTYNFPDYTSVNIASQAGNITQASGSTLRSDFCIYLTGNDVNVNGFIYSRFGGVNLHSRSGVINIGSTGSLYSSPTSPVNLLRAVNTGPLVVNSDGFISAGGGLSPLYIGNSPYMNFANGSVTLTGSTFSGITGTYEADIDLDSGSANLLASKVYVRVVGNPTPPSPPSPTPTPTPTPTPDDSSVTPEKEKEAQEEAEAANNDAVNYEEKRDQSIEDLNDLDEDVINDSQIANLFDTDDKTVGEADFNTLLFTCSGDDCDKYVDDSAGSAVVDTLINGYPYENEYAADENGLLFAYEAGYSPHGLQGFLETVEHLENMAKVMSGGESHGTGNNLFSYKHPPSSDRIAKVKSGIDTNNMLNENKKVNKRRYKKMVKIVD